MLLKIYMEFNESWESTATPKRFSSPQQCSGSPLLQCQHYAIRNVKKKLCLSLLHGGKRWVHEGNIDKYATLCFSWTDGVCRLLAEHQKSVQCRRIQMSDEVTSLSRCCNPAVVSPTTLCITLTQLTLFTMFRWSCPRFKARPPSMPLCPWDP